MARVLAISSQVARGHVGLSAIVPALQALGHEAMALPTILLSNHPGHARFAGERTAPDLLRRMLDALDANGWLAGVDAVLTGYLPSPEHVDFAAAAVEQVRRRTPGMVHVCDPVLGDEPKGLYIAETAAIAIRDRLVPLAQVLKMNRFECGWLAGEAIGNGADVARAARGRGWGTAIVTSLTRSGEAEIGNVLVEPGMPPVEVRVQRLAQVPNGTGDLFGALFLGHRLGGSATPAQALERAVAGVAHVIGLSVGRDELQLVAALRGLGR